MIGKRILVGLTYLDAKGEISSQVQFHGLIKNVSEDVLTFLRADGEGDFSIPFDGIEEAEEESIYHLKSTGEEVTGVNYLASFTTHRPPENES